MHTPLLVHIALEERPADWSLERGIQVFEKAPGWREKLALRLGTLFIHLGQKLVHLAEVAPRLEKKAA